MTEEGLLKDLKVELLKESRPTVYILKASAATVLPEMSTKSVLPHLPGLIKRGVKGNNLLLIVDHISAYRIAILT